MPSMLYVWPTGRKLDLQVIRFSVLIFSVAWWLVMCLQCFDAVVWVAGRASGL